MKLTLATLASIALLGACASAPPAASFDQSTLPKAVQTPAGNKAVLELVGAGDAIYVCRPMALPSNTYAWTFSRPEAKLMDRSGKQVGRYFGPPATWDYWAGSIVTGAQLETAPGGEGNLALQLVKANPATGSQDVFKDVTYIQRVNIKGGAAPKDRCDWNVVNQQRSVPYQADYIFYRAM